MNVVQFHFFLLRLRFPALSHLTVRPLPGLTINYVRLCISFSFSLNFWVASLNVFFNLKKVHLGTKEPLCLRNRQYLKPKFTGASYVMVVYEC